MPEFQNPNLISRIHKKQRVGETLSDSDSEIGVHTEIPTPAKVSLHPHTAIQQSPSSSSNSQTVFPTPPVTTHIHPIPFPPLVPFVPIIPPNMANRYAPLQLPANPGAMPQDYQTKISYFDGTGPDSARQHTKKMQDYFENYEIDDDGVRMKIFVQSLTGDVRTWFRSLQENSIGDPEALYQTFINKWEKKKDPLRILAEYNAIPQKLRPPPDLALHTFPDGFDADMAYQLRERDPQTLADMQNAAVSVEANLIAKRNRARAERKTTFKEEPSGMDQKLDAIISGMQ